MFKRFNLKEDVSSQSLVKSSIQRGIRTKILEQYPSLEPMADIILPKKAPMVVLKCHEHINVVTIHKDILFFNQRDGPYFPTLRLLHQYPDMMQEVQVDRGAIKFVLSGANIMCPGLTSKGGNLDLDAPAGTPVAVMAEGKKLALSVGMLKMPTNDIKRINKGIGVDNLHYLNDALWNTTLE